MGVGKGCLDDPGAVWPGGQIREQGRGEKKHEDEEESLLDSKLSKGAAGCFSEYKLLTHCQVRRSQVRLAKETSVFSFAKSQV